MLGLPPSHVTAGFTGFKGHVPEALDRDTIRSTGYSCQSEIIELCHRRGLHIVEVPVTLKERWVGKSQIGGPIIMEAFLMVWRLRVDQLKHGRMLPWPDS